MKLADGLELDDELCFEILKGTYINKETGKEIKIDGGWYFSTQKHHLDHPQYTFAFDGLKVFYIKRSNQEELPCSHRLP